MKVLTKELRAMGTAVTIKHRKVANRNLIIYLQVLDDLIWVLHSSSLAYVSNDSSIESLHLKFQSPNPKTIIGVELLIFILLKFLVHSTWLSTVQISISQYQWTTQRIKENLHMILGYPIS